MDITLLGRPIDLNHDFTKPPGRGNPGGGMAAKYKYIQRAIPNIKPITLIEDAARVNISDMLWFFTRSDTGKLEDELVDWHERIEQYQKLDSMKLLTISDPAYCRMKGNDRDKIFDATDAIIVSSRYTENWVKSYAPAKKVVYIGDPIDLDDFDHTKSKSLSIVGCSQIVLCKGIDTIIDVYKELPANIEKGFIGGVDIWGANLNTSKRLVNSLQSVSDWIFPNAMSKEVAWMYSNALAYISDTKYDTFCYAMVEAMASGCWMFLGNHPLYDDKPGFRFETPEDAVKLIEANLTPDKGFCEEVVQYVSDHYSLDVYRKSMSELIGRKTIYG